MPVSTRASATRHADLGVSRRAGKIGSDRARDRPRVADEFDVLLTNITKRFGETVAVDDVSFGVRRGEFFSLLGPSGCGKTTTLRMISGFDFPTSGELRIRDRVVNNVTAFRR